MAIKSNPKLQEHQRRGVALPNIKIYYKGYVTRSMWYVGMKVQKDQWNSIDSSIFRN